MRFDPPARSELANQLTGARYHLCRADRVEYPPPRLAEIVSICNSPDVYHWLFRELCKEQPYTLFNAADFISWCLQGWRAQTHFVFVITTSAGEIAAAVDIKSNRPSGSEIGYWASPAHRGVMTNAVILLCSLAAQAGYTSLAARTRKGNDRSGRVLTRAGFALDPTASLDPVYDFYFAPLITSR